MTYRLASSLVERALPRLPYAAAHGHLSVGLKIHCLGDGSHFSALVEGVLHELRSPAAETGLRYYVPLGKILAPFLPKLARFRSMRIAYRIELMRDGQVKALPRELVATVGLLMKETRVLHSSWVPGARNDPGKCSRTEKSGCSHHLVRPRDDSAASSSVVFATSFTSCMILCPEPAST